MTLVLAEDGVFRIPSSLAASIVIEHHYLHRRPPISQAFGLVCGSEIVGVCTFGVPPSRHAQISACRSAPDHVVELNRLWVDDRMPKNTESHLIGAALRQLPPRVVISYADTAYAHVGIVYAATNWHYAGTTDADRRTPRFDYVPLTGNHSRDAFRRPEVTFERVRRLPKHRYWTVTGTRPERRELLKICTWPTLTPYPKRPA